MSSKQNNTANEATTAKRGKPKPDDGKVTVRLWLDVDVIEAFKAEGPDWMDRMNAALRKARKLTAS